MGSDDANRLNEGDGGGSNTASLVSCSICLEPVTVDGDRSWAKLQCGHEFHLDCIGSAFNIKGAMQCPNCRKIEKGQWLYANSCRSFPEFSMDEWAHEEDLYDLSYSEMSFGVHWCPFGGLTRIPSFDEGEFTSAAYHELIGQQTIFAEDTAVSSASHPRPYIAHFGQIQPSSLNSSTSVSNGSDYNGHWTGPSVPNEMSNNYTFPAMDVHYHNWDHHSSPFPVTGGINAADQATNTSVTQRMPRANSNVLRSDSYIHPFVVGRGSAARSGSSVASSMIPPYQGSVARARDRVQALQAYFQQSSNLPTINASVISNARRSNNHWGFAQLGPMASSSDQNPLPSRFNAWEGEHISSYALNTVDRDLGWLTYHQATGGSDTDARTSSFCQWRGSERMPSEN